MLNWVIALVAVPVLVVAAIRFSNSGKSKSAKSQAYDPKTGIGRGAPGFQTNIQRIAMPPEIMARIRAGEEVSAAEITAAQDKMRRDEEKRQQRLAAEEEAAAGTKKKRKGVKK